jgi:hypothetical protein
MTILFAYDSADNAHAAIVAAGSLLTRQNGSSVAAGQASSTRPGPTSPRPMPTRPNATTLRWPARLPPGASKLGRASDPGRHQ